MIRPLAVAGAAALLLAGLALGQALGAQPLAYGHPGSLNGGVALQVGEHAYGLELWGAPGPFCEDGLRTWRA